MLIIDKISDLFFLCRSDISRILIRFLHLVFSPPSPSFSPFRSSSSPSPPARYYSCLAYLKTPLPLFAQFPLLRFLPSHNRIPFYRHINPLAFKTNFRTSSVFLSARLTFAKKLRVGEESHTPTSKRAFSALFKVETCGQRSYSLRCVAERQSSRRLARVQGVLIRSRASFPRKSCSL